MVKYRNDLQIVADILRATKGSSLKTHIMYRANLSFKLAERYLGVVVRAGLVALDQSGHYVLTTKGMRFLEAFIRYRVDANGLLKKLERVNQKKALLTKMCLPGGDGDSGGCLKD
jgi:predicted transcriptional regulator